MLLVGVSPEVALKMSAGTESPDGFSGAGGSMSKTTHSGVGWLLTGGLNSSTLRSFHRLLSYSCGITVGFSQSW